MSNTKIKIELGEFKFEAEGSAKDINSKFEYFKKFVAEAQKTKTSPRLHADPQEYQKGKKPPASDSPTGYTAVFEADKEAELVTLITHPMGTGDKDQKRQNAILLILLGYKSMLKISTVMVGKLNKSIQQSGLGEYDRLIFVLQPLIDSGFIFRGGSKRGTRYSLTTRGKSKAVEIITSILKEIG